MKWLTPGLLLLAGLVLYLSSRNFLQETSCGCGPPSAEENGEYMIDEKQAVFNNEKVDYQLAELTPGFESLAGQENGHNIDYEFLISSGKWARTPIGEFRIWVKLKYTKMEGGKKENNTYYYLPNVPYTQYFYKGYGLHGTYWHNNFGVPMSHGCINMAIPDAEKLFYWTSPLLSQGKSVAYSSKEEPGTRVIIHE